MDIVIKILYLLAIVFVSINLIGFFIRGIFEDFNQSKSLKITNSPTIKQFGEKNILFNRALLWINLIIILVYLYFIYNIFNTITLILVIILMGVHSCNLLFKQDKSLSNIIINILSIIIPLALYFAL